MKFNKDVGKIGVKYKKEELLLDANGSLVIQGDTRKDNHYLLRFENQDGEILYEIKVNKDSFEFTYILEVKCNV